MVRRSTATSFSFPYAFLEADDLAVLRLTIADSTEALMVLGADYTVSGATDANGFYPSGGNVVMTVAPSSAYKLRIFRDPELTQEVLHINDDPHPPSSIDAPLVKLTM